MMQNELIKTLAAEVGFDLCGVVAATHFASHEERFRRWIADHKQASLGYLERNIEKRFDARLLVEGARSIIVCAVNYKNAISRGYPEGHRAKIASYGCNTDYHTNIKQQLRALQERLTAHYPTLRARGFVDSAPLAEKTLGVAAGLGWIGRNSLLITPQYGSFIHLGELVVSEECDRYDTPFEGDHCGNCHICRDHCPTAAIGGERTIDARRCIACHTIEAQPTERVALDGWIFGCDACQHHCPHNQRTPEHQNSAFEPLFDPRAITPRQWLDEGEEGFAKRCSTTPMMRAGWERIERLLTEDLATHTNEE